MPLFFVVYIYADTNQKSVDEDFPVASTEAQEKQVRNCCGFAKMPHRSNNIIIKIIIIVIIIIIIIVYI